MPLPDQTDEDSGRQTIANIAVLVVVAVLTIVAYYFINSLEHARRFQRCLDSGRRNCVDFVDQNR